jgi:hypothetical protein
MRLETCVNLLLAVIAMTHNLNKMPKFLFLIIFIAAILTSCGNGIWTTSNSFRPKHPRFSILKDNYLPNSTIDTKYWYVQVDGVTSADGKPIFYYLGFYPNGKLLYDNSLNRQLNNTISWNNSLIVGYYRSTDTEIRVEYFTPDAIKSDTIILVEKFTILFKTELRYDTLVKSKYLLN